ncbi:MAG TPA: hypothetical protein VMF11_12610 [Candidatus Baltobacteraceae bacterium]|nr:hypothetical protein [Candidatus Baltobacteraceae bacterium]
MIFRYFTALAALAALATGVALGAAALSPKPHGAEIAFVASIQKDLNARFPTIADAEKAGYFRYTNEDDTGAISYVNLRWTSNDPQHPSQLWYGVNGKLLGADFSQPYSAGNPPKLWGVAPSRWIQFGAHVHYVLNQSGMMAYGHSTSVKKFEAAGGNINDPQAATLVKMGLAKNVNAVKAVFLFPNIWDLEVWVMPNPNGAFADKNPLVHPSANAQSMD